MRMEKIAESVEWLIEYRHSLTNCSIFKAFKNKKNVLIDFSHQNN